MSKIISAILLIFVFNNFIISKDCPSRLYNNLHQFAKSNLYYGLELKANYYNVDGDNYNFLGSSFVLTYEGDKTIYNFEMRFEPKKYARHKEGTERSPFKFRMINIDHSFSRKFSIIAGRQEISYGNGLVLDDFFDGLSVYLGKKKRISAGLGIYSIYSAKEALECQKGFFNNYTNSWKNLNNSDWGDIKMGYLKYSFRIKKNDIGFLLLRMQSNDPNFSSSILSFSSKLKLFSKWKLNSEVALQYFDESKLAYGVSSELYKSFRFKSIGNILTKIRYLYGSSTDAMFTPLFGNLYIGDRQHYSARQGSIIGGELKYTPAFFKKGTLKLGYFRNLRKLESISDEFDLGFELNLTKSKKIRLLTTYSIWSGVTEGSQIMTNLRIIL